MFNARIRSGLDVLTAQGFAPIAGLCVGLVTHAAAVNCRLAHAADIFADAPGVRLAAAEPRRACIRALRERRGSAAICGPPTNALASTRV